MKSIFVLSMPIFLERSDYQTINMKFHSNLMPNQLFMPHDMFLIALKDKLINEIDRMKWLHIMGPNLRIF